MFCFSSGDWAMPNLRNETYLGGGEWQDCKPIEPASWTCGYCGEMVSCKSGYFAYVKGTATRNAYIRLCPNCDGPTVFTPTGKHYPLSTPGSPVSHVPDKLHTLYEEARTSAGAGAYTAAVLVCRKMLMNIAVEEKADEGKTFAYYVEYLADNGFVPPKGKAWVNYIRKRGNEATHEIALMSEKDATALITLVEMLLRFNYALPNMVPQDSTDTPAAE
jgi:hypothetical protein